VKAKKEFYYYYAVDGEMKRGSAGITPGGVEKKSHE
jgi:hypothetical protein